MTTKKTSPIAWLPIALSAAITVAGWIANAATISARLTELDQREVKLEARYDREVVPRPEHEAADKAQELRLERMEVRLDKMQSTLDEINANLIRRAR
jgi:hypothetical protein